MEYRMIIRQTLFDFDQSGAGRLELKSVKFLADSLMKKKNNLLLVREDDAIQFFIGSSTPVARLTGEQFNFVIAATKFFGYLPGQKQLPVWLWADSLEMSGGQSMSTGMESKEGRCEPVLS